MLFRQIRDVLSGSYTYLLADADAGQAVVIDPVAANLDVLLAMTDGLSLCGILLTHVHAGGHDSAIALRERTGAPVTVSNACLALKGDERVGHRDHRPFGNEVLHVIATPGHTPCSVCYRWRDRLFTGDTLLIGEYVRMEAAAEDAGRQFDSVAGRLFALPPETLVYPARDANGRTVSTIAEERSINPCFGARTREEFLTQVAARRGSELAMDS